MFTLQVTVLCYL